MELERIDWILIAVYFAITLLIGLWAARRASQSADEFFLSGRSMPWWLLGFSMVATTFSTDTPNLVTDIVRQHGVSGNWVWWAFLLTGMLTVFVYAKLWRRTGVMTDIEFYEKRYSGRSAAFLRGFRALYLGVFFNVFIMGSVSLAAIKIGAVMLNFTPIQTLLVAGLVTVVFSTAGGFRGVIMTDFFLFITAMVGAVVAAVVALGRPEVGGLSGLMQHSALSDKLSFFPKLGSQDFVLVLIMPLTIQWWACWYPGAEPGGGGYIAQRMLAAKSERHAVGATLFFNAAHYALRPWPWILVGLCSLIVFPDLASLATRFPNIPADKIGHDLAYPAMLTFLPPGLLGLVMASLIAAYMSTISTHLNWGSSYVVNDFYKRFINPAADEPSLVRVGRISTVGMMGLMAVVALILTNAKQSFDIMLQIGAGTGLLYLLRWFWWRINAWSEISAMVISFLVAIAFEVVLPQYLPAESVLIAWKFPIGVAITTAGWLLVTVLTPPTNASTLRSFCRLARPGGPGWAGVLRQAEADGEPIEGLGARWSVPLGLLCMLVGCLFVYAALFGTGFILYGQWVPGLLLIAVAAGAAVGLFSMFNRVTSD